MWDGQQRDPAILTRIRCVRESEKKIFFLLFSVPFFPLLLTFAASHLNQMSALDLYNHGHHDCTEHVYIYVCVSPPPHIINIHQTLIILSCTRWSVPFYPTPRPECFGQLLQFPRRCNQRHIFFVYVTTRPRRWEHHTAIL